MVIVHPELHDIYISGVEHIADQLVLPLSDMRYSEKLRAAIDARRSRLIFTGVTNLDAKMISGYTWFTRKPKFYQTARELLELAKNYPKFRLPISEIIRIEGGYVLNSQATGGYFIMASGSHLEEWTAVDQAG